MTSRLDADVVMFFKSMGPVYQSRMNRVLRSYMQARLSKIIDDPEMERFADEWAKAVR